jgi:hypothetical protein
MFILVLSNYDHYIFDNIVDMLRYAITYNREPFDSYELDDKLIQITEKSTIDNPGIELILKWNS